VPRQRCVGAAAVQSIELPFAQFAELRGVAPIAEVGAQQRNREHPDYRLNVVTVQLDRQSDTNYVWDAA
jgi:hypothetical protein